MFMSKRDRLAAAVAGEQTDRPLVALWRHFPVDDMSVEQLALSTVAFQQQYDWDFIKLTPASSYATEGWGNRVAYRGHPEGTSLYITYPIEAATDWAKLRVLEPTEGALGAHIACIRRTRELAGPDIPILVTVFSPITQARHLVGGDREIIHLRRYWNLLRPALDVITETTARFVQAALGAGADGIFYATQHASADRLSEAEYRDLCRPLDLQVLDATRGAGVTMLHLHGLHTYFGLVADYPVQALNWHDRETGPALAEGVRRFPGLVVGGLSQDDLVEGTPESIATLAANAIAALDGRRLCLSTGCVLPTVAPWGNIRALRRAVDS